MDYGVDLPSTVRHCLVAQGVMREEGSKVNPVKNL